MIIETDVFADYRGYFTETYKKPKYEAIGMGYICIENIIDKHNGKLLISSGDATVIYRNGTVYYLDDHRRIRGSVVYIEICKC